MLTFFHLFDEYIIVIAYWQKDLCLTIMFTLKEYIITYWQKGLSTLPLVPPPSGAIGLRGRLSSYLEHKLPQQASLNIISKAVEEISVIRPALSPILMIAL